MITAITSVVDNGSANWWDWILPVMVWFKIIVILNDMASQLQKTLTTTYILITAYFLQWNKIINKQIHEPFLFAFHWL